MENFNVVFLGGSITEGAGASSYEKSYVYKIGEHIKKIYNDKKVNIFNAGASGTGSEFGLFRLNRDVIQHNPDLVFIEFAVNDRIVPANMAAITMETIIRKLLELPKVPAVVILITPTGMADACSSVHKKVAYYYNVPVIDIQDYVYKNVGQDKYSWQDISVDNLHPNDRGHYIYSKCILEVIKNNIEVLGQTPMAKQKPISGSNFRNPMLVSYERAAFYGHWREEKINMPKRMELAAVTDTVGDYIEFKFRGTYIGITTLLSRVAGVLQIAIDNNEYELDLYRDMEPYFITAININNLLNAEHRMILRLSEKKNPASRGNRVVIGNFLVDEAE